MPDGVLLELPYMSPKNLAPEAVYEYLYNRVGHRKPIANQVYTGSKNTRYTEVLHDFSVKVNELDNVKLDKLVERGMKYIAIKKTMVRALDVASKSTLLELVAQDGITAIFIVTRDNDSEPVDIKTFVYSIVNK